MKLIVISNPIDLSNEHALLGALFEAGLEYFHLRKPDFTYHELERYIQLIPTQYQNRVVVHSHHQLAHEYGLKGVHYTKHTPYLSFAAMEEYMHQSASFHSLEELKTLNTNFQYVFLSPVFNSISKKNYHAAFEKNDLEIFLNNQISNCEIIALGGIDEDTIKEAMRLGFDGAAVLGALWQSADPIRKFDTLQKVCAAVNEISNEHHV